MHIINYKNWLKSVCGACYFQPPPHYGKEEDAWRKSPEICLDTKPLNICIPYNICWVWGPIYLFYHQLLTDKIGA